MDLTCGGLDVIEFNNFSFKLNFAQFFFLFVKFMLTYFQSVHKCAVIQWFLWKFLASFLVSTMSSYLAFGHSFDWSYHFVFIQGWCHFILVIHFWSYHLFHTGMVPFSFWLLSSLIFLLIISSALPFVFQGWCHFHLSHWKLL